MTNFSKLKEREREREGRERERKRENFASRLYEKQRHTINSGL